MENISFIFIGFQHWLNRKLFLLLWNLNSILIAVVSTQVLDLYDFQISPSRTIADQTSKIFFFSNLAASGYFLFNIQRLWPFGVMQSSIKDTIYSSHSYVLYLRFYFERLFKCSFVARKIANYMVCECVHSQIFVAPQESSGPLHNTTVFMNNITTGTRHSPYL